MLIKILKEKYGYDTPIFTDEILSLFPQYTKAYVFRLIKAAENEGSLSRIDTGVYYIPQNTPFGQSVITGADIARKKYIQSNGNIYGLYSGLTLQNEFSVTTQMTNTPEIVTNRESTRCRKVFIDEMPFVVRKSRTKITNENVDAYRILQLFTETNGLKINDETRKSVSDFIEKRNINRKELLAMSQFFPAKTLNNLIYSGVT